MLTAAASVALKVVLKFGTKSNAIRSLIISLLNSMGPVSVRLVSLTGTPSLIIDCTVTQSSTVGVDRLSTNLTAHPVFKKVIGDKPLTGILIGTGVVVAPVDVLKKPVSFCDFFGCGSQYNDAAPKEVELDAIKNYFLKKTGRAPLA